MASRKAGRQAKRRGLGLAMRYFLYVMVLLGGAIPMGLLVLYFTQTPFPVDNIVVSLFANPLMSGFTADLVLSTIVFLVWTFVEYRRDLLKWLVLLFASCFVGLSFALPLHLLMKYGKSG